MVSASYSVIAIGQTQERSRLALLTAVSATAGFTVESVLIALGIVSHVATWPSEWLAPAWIIALWFAYGATIPTTARLLGNGGRLKGVLLGAVFGPLAYVAGSRIGAIEIAKPTPLHFIAIAALWGTAQFVLVTVATGGVRNGKGQAGMRS
jgi:hypothetical protein